jgi:hypothetical protein
MSLNPDVHIDVGSIVIENTTSIDRLERSGDLRGSTKQDDDHQETVRSVTIA